MRQGLPVFYYSILGWIQKTFIIHSNLSTAKLLHRLFTITYSYTIKVLKYLLPMYLFLSTI